MSGFLIAAGLTAVIGLLFLLRYVRAKARWCGKVGFFTLALSTLLLMFDQGLIKEYHTPCATQYCVHAT